MSERVTNEPDTKRAKRDDAFFAFFIGCDIFVLAVNFEGVGEGLVLLLLSLRRRNAEEEGFFFLRQTFVARDFNFV